MHVHTVAGPIGPEDLGATLMHEHVTSVAPGGFYSGGQGSDIEELAERALSCLPAYGCRALVDLTGRQRAQDDDALGVLRRLASRVQLHLVVGFSFYKDPWLEAAGEDDIDRLTGLYVRQAVEGRGGIRVGLYGEVGTSLDRISAREELHPSR